MGRKPKQYPTVNGWTLKGVYTRRAVHIAVKFIARNPGCTVTRVQGEIRRRAWARSEQLTALFSTRRKDRPDGHLWSITTDHKGKKRVTLLPGAELIIEQIDKARADATARWKILRKERLDKRRRLATQWVTRNKLRAGDLVVTRDKWIGLYAGLNRTGFIKVIAVTREGVYNDCLYVTSVRKA